MKTLNRAVTCFVLAVMFSSIRQAPLAAQTEAAEHPGSAVARDGQHDFDFDFGRWKVHLKRLPQPLTGSNNWLEYDGSSTSQKIWDGRAQLEQFEADGPAGKVEGMTLRLYDPEAHQWRLHWASSKDGILNQPTIGEFKNGIGEFVDQEPFRGRSILVRYAWSNTTSSPHFEQSFSDDAGKTWEANWITDQTRVSDEAEKPDLSPSRPAAPETAEGQGGAHDFDFEFGSWKAHLKRLAHPLSGSNTWVEYEGTSVVRRVWKGRANLGELEVSNATSHIKGLTLRLYRPQAHQWYLYWANSNDGNLAVPTVGQFKGGRGEFFDQEDFNGRAILVRFIFSDITANSFRTEQAFSEDGGKTWETNWIGTFTR